jgi:hypothetical protein
MNTKQRNDAKHRAAKPNTEETAEKPQPKRKTNEEQIAEMLDQEAAIQGLGILRERGGICGEAAAAVKTCFELSYLLETHGKHVMRLAARLGDIAKKEAIARQRLATARTTRNTKTKETR